MAQAASKTCEVCVSAPGSEYCIDFEEYYCENCKLLHNRQKLSRNHQFQKASDLIPEGKSKCSEHKEELTLFCNTCNVPACTSCVTGNHKGHTFSKFVDAVAKLQVENKTKIRAKTNEANQNIKKIEESLKSFDNSVESVIKTITDEGSMIKRMVDEAVAQMITLVKEQSKKEKDKPMKMLSDAKSVRVAGQALNRKRNKLDKTRQDESLVQKIINLKEEISKLTINSLPKFPNISFKRKSVAEDDIRQLIGTYNISNVAPVLEKEEQRHGNYYRCSDCGLNNLHCDGFESKLINCKYNDLYCAHYNDVGIQCVVNYPTEDHGNLRLIGGKNENEGRLEINLYDEWGTVCDNLFDNLDASVACKQLGYCTGTVLKFQNVADGNDTIWLSNVGCLGSEMHIINCSHESYIRNCGHQDDVGVTCFSTCPATGQLRIIDGAQEHEGRLEIYLNGSWGTVCDDYFDDIDATVACYDLGYCSGREMSSKLVVDGHGTIWIDDLTCSGIEDRLNNCKYTSNSNCRPNEDVRVRCSAVCPIAVNGGLSLWSEWSGCYCGGYQFRIRTCTNPAPRYGGKYGHGLSTEQRQCSIICFLSFQRQHHDPINRIRLWYKILWFSQTTHIYDLCLK